MPPRKLAPSAVRPSLVGPTVTLAADSRMSRSVVGQRIQIEQLPVPVARAAGEQAEGRDIGREVERAGGQRRLQGLAAVVGVGHHAFGDVAVEFDVDIGQRDRGADDIGARLQREAAEPAAARRRLAGPAQRVAQARRCRWSACLPSSCWCDRRRCRRKPVSAGALAIRAFRPERSPDSAATKSLTLMLPSTRSPRQSNWPVAAKEREIDGQASDRSISSSASVT